MGMLIDGSIHIGRMEMGNNVCVPIEITLTRTILTAYSRPMLPLHLFKIPAVCAIIIQNFLFGIVYYSHLYYLPIY
jgi:hypothetical protein